MSHGSISGIDLPCAYRTETWTFISCIVRHTGALLAHQASKAIVEAMLCVQAIYPQPCGSANVAAPCQQSGGGNNKQNIDSNKPIPGSRSNNLNRNQHPAMLAIPRPLVFHSRLTVNQLRVAGGTLRAYPPPPCLRKYRSHINQG